ncbi:MAG: chemotaxis protein CheR [Oscillospiraceae bacterium]|jgi:chemotaxis protein methyltransferase CheR|nr:chemotaxis protein CheR [Oscillospiraceae bacterium]
MHINDADFKRLRNYMQSNYGINLVQKRTLIEGRLSAIINRGGYTGFTDFLDAAFADKTGGMIDTLLTRLTTNYTYFMREESHYRFLNEIALPEWTSRLASRDLRTWSAGCSSGEEPYTLAMIYAEFLGEARRDWDAKILATDISPKALTTAKLGVYSPEHIERLPPMWAHKYFDKQVNRSGEVTYAVKPVIKQEINFGQFNLMGSFMRFRRKFHIIFCRNVMIYFENATKRDLAEKYYNALEPGGYLIIGQSESLSGIYDRFRTMQPSVYRKE